MFGSNTTSSMECAALEYYPADQIVGNKPVVKGEFHSFLSGESDQNAATATAHMCATVFNLLRMLSMKYNIVIDRAVGAP
eukprot:4600906-Ditylum_brightwellii.AAC.1